MMTIRAQRARKDLKRIVMIGSPFLFLIVIVMRVLQGPLEKPLLSRRRSIGEPFLLVKGKFEKNWGWKRIEKNWGQPLIFQGRISGCPQFSKLLWLTFHHVMVNYHHD
jgi:hypothetical protein